MTSKATNPRYWVWRLLQAVWQDGAYANLAWPRLLAESRLSDEDRKFATELGYGALRHWGQLNQILEKASGRSMGRVDPEVLWLLVLGAHQLIHMRIPAHAAVNETVNLTGWVKRRSAQGFVNAVLRKVASHDCGRWCEEILGASPDPAQALALETSHPGWIVAEISRALDRDDSVGELREALVANNEPARVTLALLPGLAHREPSETPSTWSPLGVYRPGNPADDQRVLSSRARVQDEGSQLAALIASSAIAMEEGERVLDACAGPGGKAAILAAEVVRTGGSLTAIDKTAHRAELVREALAGFADSGSALTVHHADTVEFLSRADSPRFHRILLDAPCSGLGALRRRPEARWKKRPEEIPDLVALQRQLARACFHALEPGGLLFYVTCSPVVGETTEVIDWLANHEEGLELLDTGVLLDRVARQPVPRAKVGTAVQLWPHRHQTDAMFIQAMRRSDAVRLVA